MRQEERDGLRRAAEALLCEVTGARAVVRLCPWCGSDAHGLPVALGSEARVSISYAPRLVAVAWSWAGPVGIDVEAVGPPVGEYGDRTAWTRTEALLKATGEGLRRDPRDLPGLPELPTAVLDLPAGYVGSVAGAEVRWRITGPAAPGAPAAPGGGARR